MPRTANISFNTEPVDFNLNSRYVVLLDPLALDGLRGALSSLGANEKVHPWESIARMNSGFLRVGVHEVEKFKPGMYRLHFVDIIAASDSASETGACDIDSGTLIVVDYACFSTFVRSLTWERYDQALQSPVDDYSRFDSISQEIGGPYYALMSSDAERGGDFVGDGSYMLRHGSPLYLG